MEDNFLYDIFLGYSANNATTVRKIANRLKDAGLRVWFDEWEVLNGTDASERTEIGLENSRILILCVSVDGFKSGWPELENQSLRFRDPANDNRRFILLRLDDAPLKGWLEHSLYIDWMSNDIEKEYSKLLRACLPPTQTLGSIREHTAVKFIRLNYRGSCFSVMAFSPDRRKLISGGQDGTVQFWDVETGRCLQNVRAHTDRVRSVAWSFDQRRAISGTNDKTVSLWDAKSGICTGTIGESSTNWRISATVWSNVVNSLASGGDENVRVWAVEAGDILRVLMGHKGDIRDVALSIDKRNVLSGSEDQTLRYWDIGEGRCLRSFTGHTKAISSVALGDNKRLALSGSEDCTVRVWDIEKEQGLCILEGHSGAVSCVAFSTDSRFVISGSEDKTIRLWNVETKHCLRVLVGHTSGLRTIAWAANQRHIFSADAMGGIQVWDLTEIIAESVSGSAQVAGATSVHEQVLYTNAKVLLVGESGVGKTGLSKRLALQDWQPSDSTIGAWATHWKLPVSSSGGVEREIWLWDFGGQADQRLIHQLYMDETALAVLVFDGQKEDLFETLGQWDRDLTRASHEKFKKLLVAGRVDAGGLRASRQQVESFACERGFDSFLETSAKTGVGCEILKHAIIDGISWEEIPWRTSPALFKRLKEEIIKLKDDGFALMRFNDLRGYLQLRIVSEPLQFSSDELKAVVGLLVGPGAVWELKFGSWVLLQPEWINVYAQAVIQTLRDDIHERGCIDEQKVLRGELAHSTSTARLPEDDERIVLLAMHQALVERALCVRETTEAGTLLIFPIYYRRERPELMGHPAIQVSYKFDGFLDDVYATLVVRLHHTPTIVKDQLWRYAADFKTLTGKQLGVKLTRLGEGSGEVAVYFDGTIPIEERIIFSKYVHEHIVQKAQNVVRLRHYVCPNCGVPVGNRDVAMSRLENWLKMGGKKPSIICVSCEKRFKLWDEMERYFASPNIQMRVKELQTNIEVELDNESKERALVGEVISTVALAGQISREFNVSDHGVDMEIEFKSESGNATGQKLYLQLKSGDSYLRKREGDSNEIFAIKNERHIHYWAEQAFPLMLVVRNSDGEVRWMDVRDQMQNLRSDSKIQSKQIIFTGERFDVMSVRRWRDRTLSL